MKRLALLLIAVSMLMTTGCCWSQPCGPGGCPPAYGSLPQGAYYGGTAQAAVPTYAANPYIAPQTAIAPVQPLPTY